MWLNVNNKPARLARHTKTGGVSPKPGQTSTLSIILNKRLLRKRQRQLPGRYQQTKGVANRRDVSPNALLICSDGC